MHDSTALDELIDGIHAAVPEPARVAEVLQGHVGNPALLSPGHRLTSPDTYRTNVVHVAPDGAFSLVALVWLPGQRTPIHSHRSWCVVGVHEGVEEERTFSLGDRHGEPALALEDVRRYGEGAVTWLSTDEEIHDVTNAGPSTAISLHVYGLDYRSSGSSILTTFDLPIVQPALV